MIMLSEIAGGNTLVNKKQSARAKCTEKTRHDPLTGLLQTGLPVSARTKQYGKHLQTLTTILRTVFSAHGIRKNKEVRTLDGGKP